MTNDSLSAESVRTTYTSKHSEKPNDRDRSQLPKSMQWNVKATLLGTGTSLGVPVIGCSCAVCRSADPHDKRLRCSLLLTCTPDDTATKTIRILVDTTPDLRQQMLTHGVSRVDAIFYTHDHADHVHGIDDVRPFMIANSALIPTYASSITRSEIRQRFPYVENPSHRYLGGLLPGLAFNELTAGVPIHVESLPILPIPLMHGVMECTGYRIGEFAYLTDASIIPDESWPLLKGVKILVIDACRARPHPTHFNFEQAIAVADRMDPDETYFIHLSHDHSHRDIEQILATSTKRVIAPGYDGQTFRFSVGDGWINALEG